jgi:tRNA(Ile)-lysidine synthase
MLPVKVEPNARGIQAAARDARYAALGAWMAEEGVPILLTAHHLDDQAETLMMRLLRGSGVAGLASIRAVSSFPAAGENARLCRPLLAWRRAELAELVQSAGIRTVDDPSNVDPAFDRARLRARLSETPWLHAAPLARSAAALAAAEEALQWAVDRLEAERIAGVGEGFTLDASGLPSELVRRLVRRVLSFLDPGCEARGEKLTRLIETLEAGGTATLAGAKATGGPLWRFERAPQRRID